MLVLRRPSSPLPLLILPVLFASSAALAAGGAGEGASVIRNIGISVVAASALGFLMKVLRQPLLLGYILGGVLVGPIGLGLVTSRGDIEIISQLGLILLLFMIGLEIDLKKMLDAGRFVVVTGLVQFPLSLAIAFGSLWAISRYTPLFGLGTWATLYLAAGIGLSSTMIVVKLLYDKLELDTVAGRLTLGILVFQDIWAIIVLAIQPNLANPELGALARTFGAGALLVAVSLMASRYVLPRIFQVVAKVPELMLVLSLGWCFLVGTVAQHPAVGLSMEMGALIAGISLATFPYNLDVNAKVINIRDFFITLFFVSLGMQIPMPELGIIVAAFIIATVLIVTRGVAVFGVLHLLRAGHWSSILPTINLSQMSEFALVILALGVTHEHITQHTLALGIWTFALLAVASTYQIADSHRLEKVISRWLNRIGLADLRNEVSDIRKGHDRPVVLLGFFRIATAFLEEARRRDQSVIEQLKAVDFNPEVRTHLVALGVPCIYGDISNPDTLHHAKIDEAQVVICTVPDSALRGTSNQKLLHILKDLCPRAELILTAETPEQARSLYDGGADYVLQPSLLAGSTLLNVVEQAMRGSCEGMRQEAKAALAALQEDGRARGRDGVTAA